MSRKYHVLTASNGIDALKLLKENDVSLVVSDVMMPEMDGYEFCRAIKSDIDLSHIPVILLTAKVEDEDAVTAYESGADGYITKPFTISRLLAKINSQLNSMAKLRETFKQHVLFDLQELNCSNYDEDFLKKVMECIKTNYYDSGFDQTSLSISLGVSKSTMHRKLSSLVGMSASNLIKEARLRAAYEYISKNPNARVSEVAFAVGFNDPKYFSTCFKKKYSFQPSSFYSTDYE